MKRSMVALCGIVMPAALVVGWSPASDHADAVALARKVVRGLTSTTRWCDMETTASRSSNTTGTDGGRSASRRRGARRSDGGARRAPVEDEREVAEVRATLARRARELGDGPYGGSTLGARKARTLFHEAALKVLTDAARV